MQRRIQVTADELHAACRAVDADMESFGRLEPHLAIVVAVAMAREAPLKRLLGITLLTALERLSSAERSLCLAEQSNWLRLYPVPVRALALPAIDRPLRPKTDRANSDRCRHRLLDVCFGRQRKKGGLR